MEEYYSFIWFILFLCWLFITGFLFLTAEDAQKDFNKLIQHNKTVLDKHKQRYYESKTIKPTLLDHNDTTCNCGDDWIIYLSHSEF